LGYKCKFSKRNFTSILKQVFFNKKIQMRSPRFNVALVTELETREPEQGNIVRKFWDFLQFGYKLGYHTDISLLVGTRQAGNICIGGVCRFEPEFRGVELKLLTRL
jgi:hypothetical protein